jgi:hypothetical protein
MHVSLFSSGRIVRDRLFCDKITLVSVVLKLSTIFNDALLINIFGGDLKKNGKKQSYL